MQCENCKRELPADDWVLVRGGPSVTVYDKLALIVKQYEAVFCSEECMRKRQAIDHEKKRGY